MQERGRRMQGVSCRDQPRPNCFYDVMRISRFRAAKSASGICLQSRGFPTSKRHDFYKIPMSFSPEERSIRSHFMTLENSEQMGSLSNTTKKGTYDKYNVI
jgi:hypothetical protein